MITTCLFTKFFLLTEKQTWRSRKTKRFEIHLPLAKFKTCRPREISALALWKRDSHRSFVMSAWKNVVTFITQWFCRNKIVADCWWCQKKTFPNLVQVCWNHATTNGTPTWNRTPTKTKRTPTKTRNVVMGFGHLQMWQWIPAVKNETNRFHSGSLFCTNSGHQQRAPKYYQKILQNLFWFQMNMPKTKSTDKFPLYIFLNCLTQVV